MRRLKLEHLFEWKKRSDRKPLLLKGARQVGKTFLIEEFGKSFNALHEFNFQRSPQLKKIFEYSSDPSKIVTSLEIVLEKKINIESDLIFFDEIQDCPKALNSLKFFCEDMPSAMVIGAGSLLGVYLSEHSFPVGKVEFMELWPMNFEEFLLATGKEILVESLKKFSESKEVPPVSHELFLEELRNYYIVGGMPEVIKTYIKTRDLTLVREKQLELLTSYKADFAKYSGQLNALQVLSVFESIPPQLAKDNKKFQFNIIKSGGRYAQFKSSIDWLTSAGLAHKLPIIESAEIPLKIQAEENMFKLYFIDVGLLGALAEVPLNSFLPGADFFKTFKGAFVENFVLQEFRTRSSRSLYCWQGKSSEVDFLFDLEGELCPVEVKSGESGKLKSLHVFSERYQVRMKTRISAFPFMIRKEDNFMNVPIYLSAYLIDALTD